MQPHLQTLHSSTLFCLWPPACLPACLHIGRYVRGMAYTHVHCRHGNLSDMIIAGIVSVELQRWEVVAQPEEYLSPLQPVHLAICRTTSPACQSHLTTSTPLSTPHLGRTTTTRTTRTTSFQPTRETRALPSIPTPPRHCRCRPTLRQPPADCEALFFFELC
ncbi:uncharacterized protein GGS25DRAFT_205413 [Hypoxylon fragiforme]|uniref:uncharacterized protein n=1 Tax=Hypoxylon fragiforme TaxID=63214 RepID=UPI0020C70546|nr:uncharacterized protein GGS25DRAFT_205413 [Hypoxylon fragiforme]KAI2611678.1 hypothetical protein GGS25DRAFT_205413 [Hypoxylon fragiforme]